LKINFTIISRNLEAQLSVSFVGPSFEAKKKWRRGSTIWWQLRRGALLQQL